MQALQEAEQAREKAEREAASSRAAADQVQAAAESQVAAVREEAELAAAAADRRTRAAEQQLEAARLVGCTMPSLLNRSFSVLHAGGFLFCPCPLARSEQQGCLGESLPQERVLLLPQCRLSVTWRKM
jgi:hypothetical protein